MNFEKLLNEKKIEKVESENPDFSKCEEDLRSAKNSFNSGDYEWAENIAYNSVLRAGIKLMAFLGYRAIGKEHHKNLFEFLSEINLDKNLTFYFNKIRAKRNQFIYRDISSASKEEAKEVILNAEKFVLKIRTFVHKIRTGSAK